jgi:hypothetical protein
MFAVEIYAVVRQFVLVKGHSRHEAARVFGVSRVSMGTEFSLIAGIQFSLVVGC